MSVFIDTDSPGTIEDIEERTPESEHTGNIRRIWALSAPAQQRSTTTAARPPRLTGREPSNKDVIGLQPGLQRTQGGGQEWFYLLSYLNARLLDSSVGHGYPELPNLLTVQLSGRFQELFGLLAASNWRRPHNVLYANVVEQMPTRERVTDFALVTPQGMIVGEDKAALTSRRDATVADVVHDLRDMIDLPVQDIARMCGVGRRQFYNLMNDQSRTTAPQERRLRDLHAKVGAIYESLDSQPPRVRAAVLTPLGDGAGSFYDAAVTGQAAEIESAFELMLGQIRRGETVGARIAPSGLLPRDHPAWDRASDFLRSQGAEQMTHESTEER